MPHKEETLVQTVLKIQKILKGQFFISITDTSSHEKKLPIKSCLPVHNKKRHSAAKKNTNLRSNDLLTEIHTEILHQNFDFKELIGNAPSASADFIFFS